MMKRRKFRLLKSRHRGTDRVAVEVERNGSVQIGTIDTSSGAGKTIEHFDSRQAERNAGTDRDDGELRTGRGNELRRGGVGAAVMADLHYVCAGMVQDGDAPFNPLLRVALE